MQAIVSAFSNIFKVGYQVSHRLNRLIYRRDLTLFSLTSLSLWIIGCQPAVQPSTRVINIQQQWELEPGDTVAERLVTGSLGDISIELNGTSIHAPFDGEVAPATQDHCIIYSSPDVPAYLFRFCGLRHIKFGQIKAGESIGRGQYLQFATLRRQPDGTWIIVEPSTGILERAIDPNLETAQLPEEKPEE